jgi:hypothetical protein
MMCENVCDNSNNNTLKIKRNEWIDFVKNKKYKITEIIIILAITEYGCDIPFLFGVSHVSYGKVNGLVIYILMIYFVQSV